MPTDDPAINYALQMAPQAKGYALFNPYPGQYLDKEGHYVRNPRVDIGDVGYIEQGCFVSLFNIHREEKDSLQTFGVPRSFEHIPPDGRFLHRHPGPTPRRMHSHSSTTFSLGGGASAPGTTLKASWEFDHERGATLAYFDQHEMCDARNVNLYKRYFRRHWRFWVEFLEKLDIGRQIEDLVLVTGCDRTRAWATLVSESHSAKAKLILDVDTSFGPSFSLTGSVGWNRSVVVPSKSGPPPEELAVSTRTMLATMRDEDLNIAGSSQLTTRDLPQTKDDAQISPISVPADQCMFVRGVQGVPYLGGAILRLKGGATLDNPRGESVSNTDDSVGLLANLDNGPDHHGIDEVSVVRELPGSPSRKSGSLLAMALQIVIDHYEPVCDDDILLMHDNDLFPFLPRPGDAEHATWCNVEDARSQLDRRIRASPPNNIRRKGTTWEQRDDGHTTVTEVPSTQSDTGDTPGDEATGVSARPVVPAQPQASAPFPPPSKEGRSGGQGSDAMATQTFRKRLSRVIHAPTRLVNSIKPRVRQIRQKLADKPRTPLTPASGASPTPPERPVISSLPMQPPDTLVPGHHARDLVPVFSPVLPPIMPSDASSEEPYVAKVHEIARQYLFMLSQASLKYDQARTVLIDALGDNPDAIFPLTQFVSSLAEAVTDFDTHAKQLLDDVGHLDTFTRGRLSFKDKEGPSFTVQHRFLSGSTTRTQDPPVTPASPAGLRELQDTATSIDVLRHSVASLVTVRMSVPRLSVSNTRVNVPLHSVVEFLHSDHGVYIFTLATVCISATDKWALKFGYLLAFLWPYMGPFVTETMLPKIAQLAFVQD
ncbi:unnamed protein product [Peniophora sp. CBMAI 1063]|nr:unnamed protein product [Peniophora sp. CBMAI 1063]